MKEYRFQVEGPLRGYRAGLTRVWDPAYKAFKEAIRLIANTHCIQDEIEKGQEVSVSVDIHWKKSARIDGSNVHKAFEDALFKQDRRLAAGHWRRFENTGQTEYAEVVVTVTEGTEGGG